MTRKDYLALAEAFKRTKPKTHWQAIYTQWAYDVRAVARALQTAPKFDAQLFFDNCGIPR